MCEYNWATLLETDPCSYRRYSQTTALLMQIFLGAFGVGISVLKWNVAIALHWGFVLLTCFFNAAFSVYSEKDEHIGLGICSGVLFLLCVLGVVATYITAVVYISGNECMDGNGIACGS